MYCLIPTKRRVAGGMVVFSFLHGRFPSGEISKNKQNRLQPSQALLTPSRTPWMLRQIPCRSLTPHNMLKLTFGIYGKVMVARDSSSMVLAKNTNTSFIVSRCIKGCNSMDPTSHPGFMAAPTRSKNPEVEYEKSECQWALLHLITPPWVGVVPQSCRPRASREWWLAASLPIRMQFNSGVTFCSLHMMSPITALSFCF